MSKSFLACTVPKIVGCRSEELKHPLQNEGHNEGVCCLPGSQLSSPKCRRKSCSPFFQSLPGHPGGDHGERKALDAKIPHVRESALGMRRWRGSSGRGSPRRVGKMLLPSPGSGSSFWPSRRQLKTVQSSCRITALGTGNPFGAWKLREGITKRCSVSPQ